MNSVEMLTKMIKESIETETRMFRALMEIYEELHKDEIDKSKLIELTKKGLKNERIKF